MDTKLDIDVREQITTEDMISKMTDVEKFLSELPDAKFGDDCAPVEHKFGDGLYIRQITMPKGMFVLSKIHKTTHPYFVMSGDTSVFTSEGMTRIIAPYTGITKAGTQRLLYMNEETVWITVHATEETDLDEIEKQVIAENYDDLKEHLMLKDGTL